MSVGDRAKGGKEKKTRVVGGWGGVGVGVGGILRDLE